MNKYQYIFFDFNGTIIDDVDLCLNLLNEMLEMKGLKTFSKDGYKEIFTFPIRKYYDNAGFTYENYTFEELSDWFIKRYQKASLECDLFPHIREILIKLNELGYHLVLLSASKKDNLVEQVESFEIINYFEDILGLDNVHAASKEKIARDYIHFNNIDPKKCLFIGDSTHDFEVGKGLGGDVLLVSYGHQSRNVLSSVNAPIIDDILEVEKYL